MAWIEEIELQDGPGILDVVAVHGQRLGWPDKSRVKTGDWITEIGSREIDQIINPDAVVNRSSTRQREKCVQSASRAIAERQRRGIEFICRRGRACSGVQVQVVRIFSLIDDHPDVVPRV